MPTYDYVCDACGHKFEEYQSMTDKLLKKCPACGKPKLRRLLGTGAAIIFKGSGFYQTDYRSESYKSGAKAEENKAPKPDAAAKDGAKPADSTSGKESKTSEPAKAPSRKPKSKE